MKKNNKSGFSLVEILVALSLLALLSGTIFHAFSSISTEGLSKETRAYNVARQTLESLNEFVRNNDWKINTNTNAMRLGAANEVNGNIPGYTINPAVNLDGTNFQCFFTVNPPAGIDKNADGQEDYRVVTGVVNW